MSAESDNVHIKVDNLKLAYGDFLIQENLNFEIARGEIFTIMGGSGCGKTTVMRSIMWIFGRLTLPVQPALPYIFFILRFRLLVLL